jgi:hypothetical protein
MGITTLKLSGREYVLLPRKEYERLTADPQDRRSVVRARGALDQKLIAALDSGEATEMTAHDWKHIRATVRDNLRKAKAGK